MAELYPTFTAPSIVEDTRARVAAFKGSAYFDFEAGDILLDSAGRVVEANGHEAWLQWCTKQLTTERFGFLGYTNDIGVEFEDARRRDTRAGRESAIARTIKDALMADPARRTSDVRSFAFAWGDDKVEVTFTVWGADGYTDRLKVLV